MEAMRRSIVVLTGVLALSCSGSDPPGASAVPDGIEPDAGAAPPPRTPDGGHPTIKVDASPDAPGEHRGTISWKDGSADGPLKGVRPVQEPDVGSGPVGPTLSTCGDGTRALDEECDDGNATPTDFCSATCIAREVVVVPQTPVTPPAILPSRQLGEGRHPTAAGSQGFAMAFVEPDADPVKVRLARFDPVGVSKPIVDVGTGTKLTETSDPVVTTLSDGSYVVAYTEFGGDGDGLGIALRQVSNTGVVSPVRFANAGTSFNQYDPDVLWTGTELVVAWADDSDGTTGPDIRYRRFDAALNPIDPVDQTLAATSAVEGRVSLAPFSSGWAAAWRAGSSVDGKERVVVRSNGIEWRTPLAFSPTPDNLPALAELDATHLLVSFTTTSDPDAVGFPTFPSVNLSVVNTAAPGDVLSVPVQDGVDPGTYDDQTSLVRVGTRVVLGLRIYVNDYNDEILLKELPWNPAVDPNMVNRSVAPHWLIEEAPFYLGDQRHPALAASPLAPQGALVVAWDSHAAPDGVAQAEPDVLAKLLPLPFVP
jgi:cysteine-rich repeat protein